MDAVAGSGVGSSRRVESQQVLITERDPSSGRVTREVEVTRTFKDGAPVQTTVRAVALEVEVGARESVKVPVAPEEAREYIAAAEANGLTAYTKGPAVPVPAGVELLLERADLDERIEYLRRSGEDIYRAKAELQRLVAEQARRDLPPEMSMDDAEGQGRR